MRVAAVFGVDDGDRAPPFILDLVVGGSYRLGVELAIWKYLSGVNERLVAEENEAVQKGLKVRRGPVVGAELGLNKLGFDWVYGSSCGDLYVSIYVDRLGWDYLEVGFAPEDRADLGI
ncbi:hypothetical protein DRQ50_11760 [bacterium]|nr:MAG: hypothetical protein DRQ50_11760 [bacterium]